MTLTARRTAITAMALLFALALGAKSSRAHAIRIFATVEREAVHGSVYVPGGSPLPKAPVTAYGPAGRLLARTETDGTGRFRLPAGEHFPLRLVAETPDGHRAEFTIAAEPADRAPPGEPPGGETAPAAAADDRALALLIEKAVARQLHPLQEQLDREARRRRLQDVLGGLGYILGLAGLAMYWAARRKTEKK